ncbi:hypothetical protein AYI69_g8368 [Smittium culicis]|uniref:Uncharacterized protein n=1 Tax=Smittium culicis TaxID=133412 RepID=A0A1R1XK10_9FUNG|nr:hypothetical protein AYI69_g8368 [Smittium culicis]
MDRKQKRCYHTFKQAGTLFKSHTGLQSGAEKKKNSANNMATDNIQQKFDSDHNSGPVKASDSLKKSRKNLKFKKTLKSG